MRPHTLGAVLVSLILAITLTSHVAGEASRITSIAPASGRAGDLVTITGNGFGARNLRVAVGGVPAEVITATGNRAVFRVPAAARPGPTTVAATNPGGHVGSIAFTVLGAPPVADAGPDQTVRVGDVVTLDGSGSSDATGSRSRSSGRSSRARRRATRR